MGIAATLIAAFGVGVAGFGFGQGGFGGGGFGGGGLQGGQGPQGGGFGGGGVAAAQGVDMGERSAADLESKLQRYLDGDEVKSILTPGEYSEWKLTLKAGQVVIAEARSEAFDPALQIVDKEIKVLRENDDRYPGDQRPLLLWRCPEDGAYALRARCFRDKSGGQIFLRLRVFETLDIVPGKASEKELDGGARFLVRIPMKAGQLSRVYYELPNSRDFASVQLDQAISPLGLPDMELAGPISPVLRNPMFAPVDGDYYILAWPTSSRRLKVRMAAQDYSVQRISGSATGTTQQSAVWSAEVRKGDVLELAAPELSLAHGAALIAAELPDISKYDLKSDENNPFFPLTAEARKKKAELGPALQFLPSRARDSRTHVFVAKRDANLWLVSNGASGKKQDYRLYLRSAAKDFPAAKQATGTLRVGNTDYWSFKAEAGDVMTFHSTAAGFAEQIVVRDPNLNPVHGFTAEPDQSETTWNMIVQRPGMYLVAVSSYGDGGGGTYTVTRNVVNARVFAKGSPAKGNFSTGDTEIWKFTAQPGEPVLVRWTSATRSYSVSICDEKGVQTRIPLTPIDERTQYGVLKVDRPTTFVIVLISSGAKDDYAIELMDLPGYGKGG
jgi:hypothetical protein